MYVVCKLYYYENNLFLGIFVRQLADSVSLIVEVRCIEANRGWNGVSVRTELLRVLIFENSSVFSQQY